MLNNWKKLGMLLLLVVASWTMMAQVPKELSPFSRLGLGDFYYQNTPTTLGMGGFAAGFGDPYRINLQNPASLGYLRTASFEAGMFLEKSEIELNGESAESLNGNLSYLSLGFALNNSLNQVLDRRVSKLKWGMNFALIPFTTVNYDIRQIISDPATGDVRTEYSGSGGTNKFVLSNGVQYGNFSGGLTLGYLFGSIENKRDVFFLDLANSYQDIFSDDIGVKGFVYDLGVMYKIDIGKDPDNPKALPKQTLTIGAYGHSATSFTTSTTRLRSRLNPTYINVADTIQSNINVKESGRLPMELTLGFTFRHKRKILVGLDYTYSDWGNYENPAADFNQENPQQLTKSSRVSGGFQFTPDASSYNRYLKRVSYRVGGYYFDDPRLTDLKTYALTFGAGFPIVLSRQRTSFFNIAFEVGQTDSDTIDENFYKVSVGFSLNDNSWFFKRKFN
ncbi:MAG: hypothetical protein ACI9XO_002794 [Paraglaciecola sp.]|jgi:hypothetical protein